jgi:hypothetical protein
MSYPGSQCYIIIFYKYCWDDEMKSGKIGRVFSMHMGDKILIKKSGVKPAELRPLRRLGRRW